MPLVHLVIGLSLVQFFLFGVAVSRARGRYKVPAPATTGNEIFERYFRVQMNTLEQLVIFVPSIWLFACYFNASVAAALGVLFIIGRLVYFRDYVREPQSRGRGFALSAVPNLALLIGAISGAIRAAIAHL